MAGIVRFHEQRYGEAVELLEKSGMPTGPVDYLAIARAARDITRSHARAESEHFIVSYPKGKDEVLVPYVLEALEAQRKALEQDLGWAAPGKVVIEILNDTRELARISTLTEEEIKTSGTIALCKFDKLMIVSPKALVKGYDWLDTAAHEYTHFVVTARTRNNTPIWLHEGLAKYSESRWRGSGGELSGWSATRAARGGEEGPARHLRADAPLAWPSCPRRSWRRSAFAEVMVAVEYLQKKGGMPLMNRILDLVAAGDERRRRRWRQGLGVPFDAFLADWKRYLLARPLPGGGDAEANVGEAPLQGRSRSTAGPTPSGRRSRTSRRAPSPGWARSSASAASGPRRASSSARRWSGWGRASRSSPGKYALAAMMSGEDAEAKSALTEALKRHPQYPALHLHLGRLYAKEKEWPAAKEHLLLANAVDPFDPEIHAGLAAAYEATGDASSAGREKRFAQLLSN